MLDFFRVARTDRGDAIGELQSDFEKRRLAIEFDAVHGERLRRQPKPRGGFRGEYPLKRQIVDGDHCSRPLTWYVVQVNRGQAVLPVVAVNDVRLPGKRRIRRDRKSTRLNSSHT